MSSGHCDKEIWYHYTFSRLWEKGAVTLWPSADDSSKQELQNSWSGRGRLSSTFSIITRWCGHGRTSLSISPVCVSGKSSLLPWWVLRKKQPPHQKNFKLRQLDSWRLFITRLRRIMSCHLIVKGWIHIRNCRFFVGEGRHAVWDMKETQIPK